MARGVCYRFISTGTVVVTVWGAWPMVTVTTRKTNAMRPSAISDIARGIDKPNNVLADFFRWFWKADGSMMNVLFLLLYLFHFNAKGLDCTTG
jgi:hypothetical protein